MDAVVPLLGTWIEILRVPGVQEVQASFPYWERGLKCINEEVRTRSAVSFPYWERGLKYACV